jgi:hypothetical protein
VSVQGAIAWQPIIDFKPRQSFIIKPVKSRSVMFWVVESADVDFRYELSAFAA